MSADLTIPTDTMAGIRAATESTMRLRVDVWRPATPRVGQAGSPARVAVGVPLSAWSPSKAPQLQMLLDLGGERASLLGIVPYTTDVRAGDELYLVGGTIGYQVLGVSDPTDVTIVALSKRAFVSAPDVAANTTVIGAWIGIGRIPTYSEAL